MGKNKDKDKANGAQVGSEEKTDTFNAEDEIDLSGEDECITLSLDEIKKLRTEIALREDAKNDAVSTAQRLQAEFDNYRKRNAAIRLDSINDGVSNAITPLLPVLDNFERGLAVVEDGDSFFDGMKLVYRQLKDTLAKLGLTEIEADGSFDPNFHDAVLTEEREDFESGAIIEVLQKGYMIHNRIIRHAMVKVAK
ncbi:MAG: nucleotide exchange factor GrpE [Clostridia bacterium]